MNEFQTVLSLLYMFAIVGICNAGNSDVFSILEGELISIKPKVTDESKQIETTPTESQSFEPVDLSNAVLTISYETTNADGEAITETLFEGPYEGDFMHVLQIDAQPIEFPDPTEIEISLQVTEESDPMTINTVIETGMDVHFAYIDHIGPGDEFLLVGSSNQVLNPKNKFSITGDLTFLELDSSHTTSAMARASFVNSEGKRMSKQWGPVLVKGSTFVIEGDIERPVTAQLYIRNRSSFYAGSAQIILEPEGELVVKKLGNQTHELAAISSNRYHEELIESWQQSTEYIALVDAWTSEYERAQSEASSNETANETEGETDVTSSEEVADAEEETDSEEDEKDTAENQEDIEVVETMAPAEGCEDAVAENIEPAVVPGDEATLHNLPLSYTLRMEASSFRTNKLQDIAKNHEDPVAQLLAMQMGVISPYEHPDEALAVWQALARKFEPDFVKTVIQPDLDRVETLKTKLENDAILVPGQKVPAFTLADVEGEDVSIYDLMSEKDLVLIDFWASWCGPCIADFPELKKLHAAYSDENFEIVGISIDDNFADWSSGVEDHELPWVQLGELKDTDNGSPVSKSYGVNYIPKTFLVDSQGCIYRKNIHPDELKTFLVDRYGLDESLEEPEEDDEDTAEISG